MKAIIMAGGEGSRLRPLTCDLPKPMVPLLDRPVMAYTLDLLRKHGIREIAATLMYRPERIQSYFGDGSAFDAELHYYIETTPLGTAGSVRQAKDFLDETFVVLSGDGVTDCDLTQALAWHRDHGAEATIVLKHVENPLPYGVVLADSMGRVTRFVEKPGWGEVYSDTVNTGIYILEPGVLDLIPPDAPFDFGRDLFPRMVEQGKGVFAWTMSGYWCDIGDIGAYLKAHVDAMDGRIGLTLPCRTGGVTRMPGARVDRGAVLEGPCFIGAGAVVQEGARIGAYTTVGAGAVVKSGASLKRAVLWTGSTVESGVQARSCVLMDGAAMDKDSAAFEESVLGGGAKLGSRAQMMPGVKVWPKKKIGAGVRLDANVVWGHNDRPVFENGVLRIDAPDGAVRAAQAAAAGMKMRSVLVGRAAASVAQADMLAVEAGFMAQGVQVYDAGSSAVVQLRCHQRQIGAEAAVWVGSGEIRIMDELGADPAINVQRSIENLLHRQDYDRAFSLIARPPVSAGRGDLGYIGTLLQTPEIDILLSSHPQVAVYAPQEQLLGLAERAMERAGCSVRAEWEEEMMELAPDEIGVWLTDSGEDMRLADENGCLSESAGQLMRVWAALEMGMKTVLLPASGTHAAEELAARYGAQIRRVKGERAAFMHALALQDRRMLMLHYDGLFAALVCIALLKKYSLTPGEWVRDMPSLARSVRSVPLGFAERGRVMRVLLDQEEAPDLTDGVSIQCGGAWANVTSEGDRPECRIVSEASDSETAEELCAFYEEKIKAILKGNEG